MTDVAASDFRHPRRYVRLDTILRLRWLAVLGQLAAIFIVAQGLEFDVDGRPPASPSSACRPCSIWCCRSPSTRCSGWSRPMRRRCWRSNIVELAGLLFFTGGLENPFSFLFLAPVLISATALPIRLTIALGILAVACASLLVFFHLPLPWDSDDPLVLPPIYLFGVWLSIAGRDRRHQPLCVPGHRGSPQALRRAGRHRTGADPRTASHATRRSRRRRRA